MHPPVLDSDAADDVEVIGITGGELDPAVAAVYSVLGCCRPSRLTTDFYDDHGAVTTDTICCFECVTGDGHSDECDAASVDWQQQQRQKQSPPPSDADPPLGDLHVDYVSASILSVKPDDGVVPEGVSSGPAPPSKGALAGCGDLKQSSAEQSESQQPSAAIAPIVDDATDIPEQTPRPSDQFPAEAVKALREGPRAYPTSSELRSGAVSLNGVSLRPALSAGLDKRQQNLAAALVMSGALELLGGVVGADDVRAFAFWVVLRVQSKVDLATCNRPLPADVPWHSWVHYLALRAVVRNALYAQVPQRFLDAFANAVHSDARSFTGASVLVVTLRGCLLGRPAHSEFWHAFGGARERMASECLPLQRGKCAKNLASARTTPFS